MAQTNTDEKVKNIPRRAGIKSAEDMLNKFLSLSVDDKQKFLQTNIVAFSMFFNKYQDIRISKLTPKD